MSTIKEQKQIQPASKSNDKPAIKLFNKRNTEGHKWRFFRSGGFDQVRIDSAQDLLALDQLDPKLWVALTCPVNNVHFDTRTLSMIDSDGDGRIRVPELIAAIKWTGKMINEPEDLMAGLDGVSVSSINTDTDDGKKLTAAIRSALKALGKDETGIITVADVQMIEKVIAEKDFNGDGIITEDSTANKVLKTVIADIIKVTGSVTDRSGKPGINLEKTDVFFKQAQAYSAWIQESEVISGINIFGETTRQAAGVITAVKAKIDDYFTRCAIAQFDATTISHLNNTEKYISTFNNSLLSEQSEELKKLPVASINAFRPLPLKQGINPAWAELISQFEELVVRPLLGQKESISSSDWKSIVTSIAPWYAWNERKPDNTMDLLGIDRIREIISGSTQNNISELIEKDKAEDVTLSSLANLEKLVRFRRDLYFLSINFVNFKNFYARDGLAIFQVGTLYLDQRSCNLCIKVDDIGKHSAMAAMAGTYLVYCECRRKSGAEKMTIVAAFTNGDSENLLVGRNGIFYDRSGNDWDATIVKIIENPISIRQAFWLPYKGLVRMIESQVAKRATDAEAQSSAKLSQAATATAHVNITKIEPPPPPSKKLDIGIVAALGVAAGALGTFVATLLGYASGIIRLGPIAIVGAAIGLLLLVSGPSVVLAYIKLRKRNLGPILDAAGWAINAKARINVPFGAVLTNVASLPSGAQIDLFDPYAEKKSIWPKIIVSVLLVYLLYIGSNHFGYVYKWTGGNIGTNKESMQSANSESKSPKKVVPISTP
jgi:Ca2+-binding EF-hand superfamily protein